ncbi:MULTISPECIES: sensor histidine kinase [unclassified Paenibacillus]|uniref:sensor histidine kinase n=1 Tax=unclassified Paenibacillus TaxID=185978 RepID=UPI001C108347|nr:MULTISPECIES: sensor histidine kinase [unclassified Paenibacillus]MBU5441697.1 sensor histidine kinase [Paenibacillus sp. MSJ-34]CAH0118111.1 hypothetical protein PAE9249_00577 [Paenibacillus sp. CECT 9249]
MWIKRSLFAKLLVGMLLASIIPFSLSNIVSHRTTSKWVEQEVISLNRQSMDLSMENIKRYLQELRVVSASYYQDNELMNNLRRTEATPLLLIQITDQLNKLYASRSEMRAVRYISAMNHHTYTRLGDGRFGADRGNADIDLPASPEAWDEANEFEATELGNERVLALHRLLVDYPESTVLGLTSLYVGMDELARLMESLSKPDKGEATFLYIQDDLRLLWASEEEDAGTVAMTEPDFGQKGGFATGEFKDKPGIFIYTRDQFKEIPLTMVKFVPKDTINESADKTLNRMLIVQLVAIAFVILFASILSFMTIAPIKRLLRSISKVQSGNFDVEPAGGNKDELGVLEQRFQTMVRNLDDFVDREYRSQLELSTARLKMLQAQINPHFLYNTLQSIGTLALRHGVEEISDKIAELGSILRYSMDLKTENVPLYKEIQHVEHYLSLQIGRFKNKLSYTLSCPDEALGLIVPKMILQPLVENSIIHGIEKGSGKGDLHIGIELNGSELCLRIIDNGKGFEPATIARIEQEYASRQAPGRRKGGIGLANVLQRLRICYGSAFVWGIQSRPYESTIITLQFPVHDQQQGGDQS